MFTTSEFQLYILINFYWNNKGCSFLITRMKFWSLIFLSKGCHSHQERNCFEVFYVYFLIISWTEYFRECEWKGFYTVLLLTASKAFEVSLQSFENSLTASAYFLLRIFFAADSKWSSAALTKPLMSLSPFLSGFSTLSRSLSRVARDPEHV